MGRRLCLREIAPNRGSQGSGNPRMQERCFFLCTEGSHVASGRISQSQLKALHIRHWSVPHWHTLWMPGTEVPPPPTEGCSRNYPRGGCIFSDPSSPRTHMESELPQPPGHVSALLNPPHYGSNMPWPPGQVTPHPSDTLSTKHPPPTGQKSACSPPEHNFWNSPDTHSVLPALCKLRRTERSAADPGGGHTLQIMRSGTISFHYPFHRQPPLPQHGSHSDFLQLKTNRGVCEKKHLRSAYNCYNLNYCDRTILICNNCNYFPWLQPEHNLCASHKPLNNRSQHYLLTGSIYYRNIHNKHHS